MTVEVNKVYKGRSEIILPIFPDNFFDSCVTDAPWKFQFMNKHWDYELPSVELWKEVLRTLKPGAHILVCCGTRTQHRMVCNIEDAGFDIRDVITHHYGSGFPKSMDISKAIDKEAGAEREEGKPGKFASRRVNKTANQVYSKGVGDPQSALITEPVTDGAKIWNGWGTALKPATEFWTLARKPIAENTIAKNVLKFGTGGINIDDSRIAFKSDADKKSATYGTSIDITGGNFNGDYKVGSEKNIEANPKGRWPANVMFDEFTGKILDQQAPDVGAFAAVPPGERKHGDVYNKYKEQGNNSAEVFYDDSGGASRFFYCPKPDGAEKDKGLENFYWQKIDEHFTRISLEEWQVLADRQRARGNIHVTVKSIDLMRYLVKLITPKGGICLDPFCGSGTTLAACKMELANWIGIDMEENHVMISEARVAAWNAPKYIEQTLF